MTTTVFDEMVARADERFETALAEFVTAIEETYGAYMAANFPNNEREGHEVEPRGRKYAKVVRTRGGTGKYVIAFVEKATGNIYKPAGWARPAKHIRGNIYENKGVGALTGAGNVRYLR